MNIVLTDNRVSDRCSKTLAVLDYVVVRLPSFRGLSSPVSAHPDMLCAPLPDGSLLLCREYYEEAKDVLEQFGINIRVTEEKLSPQYPADVLFDALAVGDTLYGKAGAVSKVLLSQYRRFVPVKQGYTRCSTAMLSDSCAVTADRGIATALAADGIKTLLIRPGHIRLDGYDTGFIGGAGGRLGDGLYGFLGDLFSHPDGRIIAEFAAENKINAVSLSDEPLSDCGGLTLLHL